MRSSQKSRPRAAAQLVSVMTMMTVIAVGCSAGASNGDGGVIARVGGATITSATLAHWMKVFAPERIVPDPPGYTTCVARLEVITPQGLPAALEGECRHEYTALRQQTLEYLISSKWTIGEARDEGLGVSARDVARALEQKQASYPNGEPEFRETLTATARTLADLEHEIEVELSSARIRQNFIEHQPTVTQAQVADYYSQHMRRYRVSERRYFYIVEAIKSEAEARRLRREFERGEKSIADLSLHESLERRYLAGYTGEKRKIADVIFAAKRHAISAPVDLGGMYFLIDITRITPAYVKPLARVSASIERQLAGEAQHRAFARFSQAWQRKWIGSTDCSPGYVVRKCRQYGRPPGTRSSIGHP